LAIGVIKVQNKFGIEPIVTKSEENIYRIQNLTKPKPTDVMKDFVTHSSDQEYTDALAKIEVDYLPWSEFRNKSWADDAKKEQIWHFTKFYRRFQNRPVSMKDKDGNNYTFNPQRHAEFLHEMDLEFGGNMLGITDLNESNKRQIIRRNLIEESIASSKLEGANTSREAARKMLNEGRSPRDGGERMIVNNHAAMQKIEEVYKNQPLSFDMIFELHRIVTNGTFKDAVHEGKLRETLNEQGKRLVIAPWDETTAAYITPDKEFVEEQLPNLIKFANDEDGSSYIHPLFKAIMLHFWIGLLHPFEDGNGRLARILFYWYMLRKGYWAFAYLSLSERIVKSPKQYAMAYIYTEQDDYDLNYFIQYNVEKLKLARQQLQIYLKEKIDENKRHHRLMQGEEAINPRQFTLLQHLVHDELRYTNVAGYHNVNPEIGYITAVNDLKNLVQRGLLRKVKTGRNVNYFATPKVETQFK
jgi:Fic family protein